MPPPPGRALPVHRKRRAAPRGTAIASGTRHSIRVTSRLTSIELDTLRMWERRYGFPKPERTEGGSRVYTQEDVDALKLIRRALDLGYRPSEVVGKPHAELVRLVASASPARTGDPIDSVPSVESLITAIAHDDLDAVRAELRQGAVVLGPRRFVTDIAQPLATRVGDLWSRGELEVRHEHMLSEALSSQLRLLASTFEDRPGAPRVLLSTLPGERHALGLEMIQVYLGVMRVATRLLGVDTPPDQIVRAARAHGVDAVGLLVTAASDLPSTARHVRWMLAELPRRVSVWLGGGAAPELELPPDATRVIRTWEDLDQAIEALGR